MPLFQLTQESLKPIAETTFGAHGIMERKDLQRLLREQINVLGDDLMVVAEEFGEWVDSSRRIDLLCIDVDANLVVVELKRTEDGGHMELQAIRYAAMVSSMTLDQVIQTYIKTMGGVAEAAKAELLDFLELDSEEEAELTGQVRIVLVSADFSTEITTSVLWLNGQGLDITCIRLRPYRMGDDILIDATQIIPLPEAADYEIKLRSQEQEKRKVLGVRAETLRRFWSQLIEKARSRTQLFANRSPTTDHWLSAGIGRGGFNACIVLTQTEGQFECYIRQTGGDLASKTAFHALLAQRHEIEKAFGGELDWQELPGRMGSRICGHLPGGWKAPESEWPEIQNRLIDGMIRLEAALRKPIQELIL